MARPSLLAYIHSTISGYSPGRSFDIIHASDVTKPEFCARRRALQIIEQDKPNDEFLTTCQRKVFDEGRLYESHLRETWCGDIAVGDWICGWCNYEHLAVRKPGSCAHCRRNAPMVYRELRFRSQFTGVSCGVDTLLLLPGKNLLTMVEVKTIAAHSPQKDTPIFKELTAPLAEHRARSSWYLKLIRDSGHPLAQFVDTQEALVFYISKGYGETTPELSLLGVLDKMTPFKEFWITRDDQLAEIYDKKAQPLGDFMRTGVVPGRCCETKEDRMAAKCPKKDACFSTVYPAGSMHQRRR